MDLNLSHNSSYTVFGHSIYFDYFFLIVMLINIKTYTILISLDVLSKIVCSKLGLLQDIWQFYFGFLISMWFWTQKDNTKVSFLIPWQRCAWVCEHVTAFRQKLAGTPILKMKSQVPNHHQIDWDDKVLEKKPKDHCPDWSLGRFIVIAPATFHSRLCAKFPRYLYLSKTKVNQEKRSVS